MNVSLKDSQPFAISYTTGYDHLSWLVGLDLGPGPVGPSRPSPPVRATAPPHPRPESQRPDSDTVIRLQK